RRFRPVRSAGEPGAARRHGVDDARGERGADPRQAGRAGPGQRRGARMSHGQVPGTGTVTVTGTGTGLVEPHGGALVDRTGERPDDLGSLPVVTLTSREVSDLDMLASGALSPLEGLMGRDDYERVVEDMRLAKGIPWALPVCLAVDHEPKGDEVAFTDEAGKPFAALEVDETYEYDKEREARHAFRTTDEA